MYEGMPLFEASDKRELKKKLTALENPPAPPYAVRVTNNKKKEMKEDAFCQCKEIGVAIIAEPYKMVEWGAFASLSLNCQQKRN